MALSGTWRIRVAAAHGKYYLKLALRARVGRGGNVDLTCCSRDWATALEVSEGRGIPAQRVVRVGCALCLGMRPQCHRTLRRLLISPVPTRGAARAERNYGAGGDEGEGCCGGASVCVCVEGVPRCDSVMLRRDHTRSQSSTDLATVNHLQPPALSANSGPARQPEATAPHPRTALQQSQGQHGSAGHREVRRCAPQLLGYANAADAPVCSATASPACSR